MHIIKEHEVEDQTQAILTEYTVYGPVSDGIKFLMSMGAKPDGCSYGAFSGDHPGDWECSPESIENYDVSEDEMASTFGQDRWGPFILYPEGWEKGGNNTGLAIRVFSVEMVRPVSALRLAPVSEASPQTDIASQIPDDEV